MLKRLSTPLQLILDDKVQLYLKREDLNHPVVSGNKWFKLKYNLLEAEQQGYQQLLTFGGAFSNHIYATAGLGKLAGFQTIGIIRGERPEPLNPTLAFAGQQGMRLHFVDRATYREKASPGWLARWQQQFGPSYIIPEGGTNELAVKGVKEVFDDINETFDYYCSPVGTGGTLAGLIQAAPTQAQVLGFPALKAPAYLSQEVSCFLEGKAPLPKWEICHDYHFGGYARFNNELIEWINHFYHTYLVPLDPIYTGKMMYGLFDLISQGAFPDGTRLLAVHTGGLQGIAGFNQRFGNIIEGQ